MRNYTLIPKTLIFLLVCIFNTDAFAQVGINTNSPRKTLEVNGNIQATGAIEIGTLNDLNNTDEYTFLMQEVSGDIKALDAANVSFGNALGYIQTYIIEEVFYDYLRRFDTGIDASKYTMLITAYNFDREVAHFPIGPTDGFAIPSIQAFIQGGKWHIKANYPTITTADLSNGTWEISTVIFTNDLVKQFPQQIVNMSNTNTAVATTAILD